MFIILFKINNDNLAATPYPRQYKTFEEATKEAERLLEAEDRIGKTFHIFELVAITTRIKVPIKTTYVQSQIVKTSEKRSKARVRK